MHKSYKSLDRLPIWNYNEICKTNDLRYLLILEDYYELPENDYDWNELAEIWGRLIYDFDELDLTLEKVERDKLVKELEFALNPEARNLKTQIAIKQAEYDRLKQAREINAKKSSQSLTDKVTSIEIILNISIDIFKTSVRKFFSYEKQAQKKAEHIERMHANG